MDCCAGGGNMIRKVDIIVYNRAFNFRFEKNFLFRDEYFLLSSDEVQVTLQRLLLSNRYFSLIQASAYK